MGKGIAITTILLLLVGSLVTGITVYYTYRSVSGSPLSEHECRGMMISWCIGCSNLNWEGGSGMDPQLKECASRYWGMGHDNCDAEDDCSAFLPGDGGGDGGDGGLICDIVEKARVCLDKTTCDKDPGWKCVIDNPSNCAADECCCEKI